MSTELHNSASLRSCKVASPKVSIIIPVYNGANFLSKAIDSALAQTYSNIEVIVINDGSTDAGATRAIALYYGEKIRYFEKENGGVATALNLGIEKMQGEYFSWLSHDDEYYPNKVQKQIEAIQNYHTSDVILFTDVEIIDEKSQLLELVSCSNKDISAMAAIAFGLINGCTVLIPKTCFDIVGIFNPQLPTTQDYDMWYRLVKLYPIKHIPEILVKSRQHARQQSRLDDHHAVECNDFYISLVKDLAEQGGYSEGFFLKLAAFLRKMQYISAYDYVRCNHIKIGWISEIKILFYTYINTNWGNRVGFLTIFTDPIRVWKKLIKKG